MKNINNIKEYIDSNLLFNNKMEIGLKDSERFNSHLIFKCLGYTMILNLTEEYIMNIKNNNFDSNKIIKCFNNYIKDEVREKKYGISFKSVIIDKWKNRCKIYCKDRLENDLKPKIQIKEKKIKI